MDRILDNDRYIVYRVDGAKGLTCWGYFDTKREAVKEARKSLSQHAWIVMHEHWVAADEVTTNNLKAL